MLNHKSDHLTVLIATYNRLPLLQKTIDSVLRGTRVSHEIIVIDGGSTDGTIEYLRSRHDVTAVLQGERIGTSRAYNSVWREVESRYTVWLSDDTEVAGGALDRAVEILKSDASIGMVGLKMRDMLGPYRSDPYMGGISEYGILNCNHGVLPMDVLRSVGFFNEAYRSYTIDPDLTASVLASGKRVVMTREVSLWHHREWALESGEAVDRHAFSEMQKEAMGGIDNLGVYRKKFEFLKKSETPALRLRRRLLRWLSAVLYWRTGPEEERWGLNSRDWYNLAGTRFIRLWDAVQNHSRVYYLVQQIPVQYLVSEKNPYRELLPKALPAGSGSPREAVPCAS